jgi:glucosamine kinase
MDDASRTLADLAKAAFAKAGLGQAEMDRAYAVLGLAGSNVVASNAPVEDAVPCAHVHVTNDPDIVLAGALGDADGCIAAPGTGSFFISRKKGKIRRLGGWGFVLGDESSGARLGARLFALSIHAHDGIRAHSDLTQEILAEFGGNPSNMVQFANRATPGDFGEYARRIVAAGQAGDPVGTQLMQEGADWIATALGTLGHESGMNVVLWGGLGQTYVPYLPSDIVADLKDPLGDGMAGAIHIAMERAAQL